MSRLTFKTINDYCMHQDDAALAYNDETRCFRGGNALSKLGEIEDIEEQLGVDIPVLFKAITWGVWYKGRFYPYVTADCLKLYLSDQVSVNIRDYKKTWTLSKDGKNYGQTN